MYEGFAAKVRVMLVAGHSGAVICLTITNDSQLLLTGSEDTSVIVWNLKTFELKMKIT